MDSEHLYSFKHILLLIVGTLLATNGVSLETTPNEKASHLISQVRTLQDVLSRFNALRVDATEYACLKALVLFKSGKHEPNGRPVVMEFIPQSLRHSDKQNTKPGRLRVQETV